MSVLETIKSRITAAMKSGNATEKNLFRVVLGEVQTTAARQSKEPNDEMAIATIKKVVAGLQETMTLMKGQSGPTSGNTAKVVDTSQQETEIALLTALLPATWDQTAIEAFFLNGDNPVFEQIRDAKNEGAAMGLAMKTLKAESAPVNSEDVKAVVIKIRNS